MEWSRRNPFLSAHYVADFHQMVINNVCQVICWESIRFQKYRIRRNVFILPNDVAKKVVVEFCFAFHWNLKTDYVWFSCIKICLYFLWSKVTAVAVVTRSHLVFCLNLADAVKAFCITEAVVSFAVFNKLHSVFFVKFKTLALNIRTKITALRTTFVPFNSKPCHCVVKVLNVFFVVACAVCVFKTKNEFSVLRTCKQIIKKCCTYATNVLHTSWRWCVTNSYLFFCHIIPLKINIFYK